MIRCSRTKPLSALQISRQKEKTKSTIIPDAATTAMDSNRVVAVDTIEIVEAAAPTVATMTEVVPTTTTSEAVNEAELRAKEATQTSGKPLRKR